MGFISCHITPLVIYSLGGGHARTHTNTYADDLNRIGWHEPGLKISFTVKELWQFS